jgi:hypothetical protein
MAGGKAPMTGVKQIVLPTGGVDDLIKLSDGTTIVDKDGNIDAPVTTTNLTTTGTTQLGDAVSDDTTVSGDITVDVLSTLTGLVTMTAGIDAKVIFAATETIAAGGTTTALDLTKTVHYIDADAGGDIFTLADGVEGQVMTLVMASATGVATVTPTNLRGGTSVTMNAAGETVILQFVVASWSIMGGNAFTVI